MHIVVLISMISKRLKKERHTVITCSSVLTLIFLTLSFANVLAQHSNHPMLCSADEYASTRKQSMQSLLGCQKPKPTPIVNCIATFRTTALTASSTPPLSQQINSVDYTTDNAYIIAGETPSVPGVTPSLQIFDASSGVATSFSFIGGGERTVNQVASQPGSSAPYVFAAIRNGGLGPELRLFSFTTPGGGLTAGASTDFGANNGVGVAWHPAGSFLAATLTDGTTFGALAIYDPSLTLVSFASLGAPPFPNLRAVGWNSTGTKVAVGTTTDISIYSITGGGVIVGGTTFSTQAYAGGVLSLDWNKSASNPDILAIGLSDGTIRILDTAPAVTPTELSASAALSSGVTTLSWNTCGTCLAAGTTTEPSFYTFSFNAGTSILTPRTTYATASGLLNPDSVKWSYLTSTAIAHAFFDGMDLFTTPVCS